ncbi:hypothetical protein BKA65DRAFT_65457 [Rhexocercosporidium sp. MPI-PUGE-AT-0058]|nr:hypothetical protein BKA65DRAFT_65457 [Rhexocercosporidium sp. MPI-PUGE-AT-0058]
MAPQHPSAESRDVVDLTFLSSDDDDDDDLPPPPRPNLRGSVRGPAIDLTTPPPPSRLLRTGASNAPLRNGEPSVPIPSIAQSNPSQIDIDNAPAVKFSLPSPSSARKHSPNPPSSHYSASTPRGPGRDTTRFIIKEPPAATLNFGVSPPRPESPAFAVSFGASPSRLASEDTPSLVANESLESFSKPKDHNPEPVQSTQENEGGSVLLHLADQDEDHDDDEEDNEMEDTFSSRDLAVQNESPSRYSDGGHQSQENVVSSIGSTSPLITRLRQQQQQQQLSRTIASPERRSQSPRELMARRGKSAAKSDTQKVDEPDLEERLRSFLQGMRDDHAMSTRYTLADAREAALEMNTLAVDKISPFTSMKSVVLEPGAPVPPGKVKDTVYHYPVQKNGKLGKGKSQIIATQSFGDTPRVPGYSSHTNVRRNILRADDEKLKFIPFLGESRNEANFKKLVRELEQVYSPRSSETSRESEENARIRQYLPIWLEELQLNCDLDTLKHYLLLHDEDSRELGMEPRNRRLLLESFDEPLDHKTRDTARGFCEAFDKVFGVASQDVILPAGLLKEMIELSRNEAAKKKPGPPANRIGTYADLTCLICAVVDCPTHGDFAHERIDSSDVEDEGNERSPEMKYEPKALNLNYEDTVRRHRSRIKKNIEPLPEGRTKSCSDECYMAIDFSELDYEFDEEHLAVLPQMITTYRHPNYRSCYIAFALDVPCWTVYAEIQRYESERHEEEVEEVPNARAKKPEWYDNKKKTIKGDLNESTTAHLHQERGQAIACGHPGPCLARPDGKGDSCPCATSNILCESFCGCSDDCPRRFTGCACTSCGLSCTTETCICIQMNRECGPECGTCGALARINPVNKYDDELFTTGCQNVYLQRGVSKAMVMGESQLVGFGLYLAEAVKKGDFLSEYAGENISSEEADRRGIVYDRKFLSFLFDLNQDRVIDAARLGNKTRFINHSGSAADGLNCEAKIVLVNGEHRIKFIALRDIDVGEELLFNYGKKFAEKQGLNKTLPKAHVGSKRGVLEGEEALDALDGMDQRKRGTRDKINAIRGGAKSGDKKGPGSKMRKTAAPMGPLVDEEQEEEDDKGDDNTSERPRRRKINRPARYSR